jgi:pilus assembly protein CpaB
MKTNRIIVLGVAVVSGLAAMLLIMSAGDEAPVQQTTSAPEEAPPAPQIEVEGVLVAQREIPLGAVISEADVTWVEWPKQFAGPGSIRRSEDPEAIETLKGAVARVSFIHGEPIRREKLVKGGNTGFMSALLPAGSRALAVNIDSGGGTSAGGFILPNDRVDLIKTSGGDGSDSETILTNIRVLAIGQNVEEKNGERVVTGSNATLEVTPGQAEVITTAQRSGQITLVLRSMFDMQATKSKTPEAPEEAGRSLTVVRFGSATTSSK